jgi:hypothetical protein
MIIIFGLRRLRKGMGPILLRCSNCGASPLVLFRVSTWFALFFIPMIPVSFKHYTTCPNCKRLDPVSKAQVEGARAHEGTMRAAGHDAATGGPLQTPTLEVAVNEWASVSQPPGGSAPGNPGTAAFAPMTQPPALGNPPDPQDQEPPRVIYCSWCGKERAINALAIHHCGSLDRPAVYCMNCGTPLEHGAVSCASCGTPASEISRR